MEKSVGNLNRARADVGLPPLAPGVGSGASEPESATGNGPSQTNSTKPLQDDVSKMRREETPESNS